MKVKKGLKILLWVFVFLVAVRLALPYGIKWYLNNKVLNHMEVYWGHVEDVNISLYNGSYQLEKLHIVKKDTKLKEPFLLVDQIDIRLQWKALFDGKIVGEFICHRPVVHFAFSEDENESQTGVEEDWTALPEDMMPIRINRFSVVDGKIYLSNLLVKSDNEVPLDNFNLEITNIQNVERASEDSLPTTISASGTSGKNGSLKFSSKAYLLKQMPDFNYDLKLENLSLTSLNPAVKHYLNMDFEGGTISLYSELAMKDSSFTGYMKPIIKDMRIFNWKEEDRNLGGWFKEFFSEGAQELLENQKRQQFATRIPVEGRIDDPKTGIMKAIFSAFENAYIEAFEYKLDKDVEYKDAGPTEKEQEKQERKEEKKEKKALKKQEKEEKRDEKKHEKEEE